MKRSISLTRLALAALLIGAGLLAFAVWPHRARWRVPSERVVGFDESHGLLLTTLANDGSLPQGTTPAPEPLVLEVRGRELNTGRVVYAAHCGTGTGLEMSRSLVLHSSPDGSALAVFVPKTSDLIVFALPSGHPVLRHRLEGESDRRVLVCLGFSRDGRRLGLRSPRRLLVWDLARADKIHDLPLSPSEAEPVWPDDPRYFGRLGTDLDFDPEGRYVAAPTEVDGVQVFDLKSERLLGELSGAAESPRFSSGGARATLRVVRGNKLVFWEIVGGELVKSEGGWAIPPDEREARRAWPNGVVTLEHQADESVDWPFWLLPLGRAAELWVGSGRVRWAVRLRDGATGRVVVEVPVRVPPSRGVHLGGGFRPTRSFEVVASPSGRFLAVQEGQELSLREVPEGRGYGRAGTLVMAGALAAWLAWPRKAKVATQAA